MIRAGEGGSLGRKTKVESQDLLHEKTGTEQVSLHSTPTNPLGFWPYSSETPGRPVVQTVRPEAWTSPK